MEVGNGVRYTGSIACEAIADYFRLAIDVRLRDSQLEMKAEAWNREERVIQRRSGETYRLKMSRMI